MTLLHRILPAAVFLTVMVSVIAGCATLDSRVPPVTDEMSRAATAVGTDPASLNRGRDLYVSSCARCHRLISIESNTAQEWQEILPRMSALSKLTPQQSEDLAAYVAVAGQ